MQFLILCFSEILSIFKLILTAFENALESIVLPWAVVWPPLTYSIQKFLSLMLYLQLFFAGSRQAKNHRRDVILHAV